MYRASVEPPAKSDKMLSKQIHLEKYHSDMTSLLYGDKMELDALANRDLLTTGKQMPRGGAAFSPREESRSGWREFVYDLAKRAMDVVVSVVGLVLLAPVFAVVAVAIRLNDGCPAIFSQARVGKDGRRFTCYKFRTMCIDAEKMRTNLEEHNRHGESVTFKIVNDPRITRIGYFLRRSSLDEIPQLWNVLIGDMSLVGPRPAIPSEVEKYSRSQSSRLAVKPGLTCIWQVSGRSELPFEDQVRLDVEYIRQRGLWLDLKLLFLTIPTILSTRGAC